MRHLLSFVCIYCPLHCVYDDCADIRHVAGWVYVRTVLTSGMLLAVVSRVELRGSCTFASALPVVVIPLNGQTRMPMPFK